VSSSQLHHQPSRLHLRSRRNESFGDLRKVGVGVVETEDQTARCQPSSSQTMGAQIVLQHPVVARSRG
jgi:hypothetical protein